MKEWKKIKIYEKSKAIIPFPFIYLEFLLLKIINKKTSV